MTEPIRPSDEARRLSHEVMRVVELEQARRRRAQIERIRRKHLVRRRKDLALAVLGATAVLLTALNLLGRGPFSVRAPRVSAITLQKGMLQGLSFAVHEIEGFRDEHGRLPHALDEIGRPTRGTWTYRTVDEGRYLLSVRDGRLFLEYDSSTDRKRFSRDLRSTP